MEKKSPESFSDNVFTFHPAYRFEVGVDGEPEEGEDCCGFCDWPKSLTPEQFLVHGQNGWICVQCVRTIRSLMDDLKVGDEE
jgi:hypothetical protein